MEPTIKMIVADLDGTLLRSDETISEYTKTVIARCRNSGFKVIYATGRGERSARSVAPYEYFDGVVTQGGAVVTAGEDIVSQCFIPNDEARPLLMFFHQHRLNVMSEDNTRYYSNFVVTDGWTSSANYQIVDFSTLMIDAEKINVFFNAPEEIDFVRNNLSNDLCFIMARDGHGMIMRKDATKIKGIMKLAGLWGISQADIVSFGDDEIDIDVLTHTGIGVAMANALPEVKAASDFLCLSNDEDGLARWVKDRLL